MAKPVVIWSSPDRRDPARARRPHSRSSRSVADGRSGDEKPESRARGGRTRGVKCPALPARARRPAPLRPEPAEPRSEGGGGRRAHRRKRARGPSVADGEVIGQPAADIARERAQVLPRERPRACLRRVRGEHGEREEDERRREEGSRPGGDAPGASRAASAPPEHPEHAEQDAGAAQRQASVGRGPLEPERPVEGAQVDLVPRVPREPRPGDGDERPRRRDERPSRPAGRAGSLVAKSRRLRGDGERREAEQGSEMPRVLLGVARKRRGATPSDVAGRSSSGCRASRDGRSRNASTASAISATDARRSGVANGGVSRRRK